MIYVKRLSPAGQLVKVEKGRRISVDERNTADRTVSKREYCCLTCAMRIILDNVRAETLSADDWGADRG